MGRKKVSLGALRDELRRMGEKGISLQRRLFAFFLLFLVIVMLGVALALFSGGVLLAGQSVTRVWLENELGHLAKDVSDDFGKLSVEGVALSGRLSDALDDRLAAHGLAPRDLQTRPELLTELLSGGMDTLQSALQISRASGAFMILNATVNPSLPEAARSRAGIYLKNMEPNAVNAESPSFYVLRGPVSLAKDHGLFLLPQWQMELRTEPGDMFELVMRAAREHDLSRSRLYYWSPRHTLDGDADPAMMLCVPLIAGDGTVLGVCGLDVSAQLFKQKNTPDNRTYARVFAMLAPVDDDGRLKASEAMFAGSYSVLPSVADGTLTVGGTAPREFAAGNGIAYTGLYGEIRLYPADSAFAGQRWALGVMMPKEDYGAFVAARSRRVIGLIALLFVISLLAAAVLSRRFMSPVARALRALREGGAAERTKTNIPEIDDLIEFLTRQDEARESARPPAHADAPEPPVLPVIDAFLKNIGTLSPAERTVFNLYLEGYDAKQIASLLSLSINTIKTHNKRIYMKLDITSRKELMVFAELMRERGDLPDKG